MRPGHACVAGSFFLVSIDRTRIPADHGRKPMHEIAHGNARTLKSALAHMKHGGN
ncbi:MAG: hypothetical protein HOA47_09395 [Verrucomicrobia bacterium]|jgi:hypothetical protein|nr:hypothetical protein [Verrucomicrobiota bacterium]MBT6805174.1 hypothetical protein [Verrucomicrobiota bacterium]MDA7534826.1 hypothetical protein [Verrucomicrobiota bacterium]MDA7631679.1 hypothetical protein [Verrucomicrobiota bacterium]